MNRKISTDTGVAPGVTAPLDLLTSAWDYAFDAAQRSLLFWDVLRQRGTAYHEGRNKLAPHVLSFSIELVLDGREFERPVNYMLARVVPPSGTEVMLSRRPFVIIDPRAGHGPGIGGFKADSEIGVAFKAGHPCYFIGFLPDPVPDQTIEDVARAEAIFLEEVIARHPGADGKPCLIGNCQAGWAVMMLAALRPELCGPLIVAGSPLSYWAGVRGQNPMRYSGGLLGGSWSASMAADLGHGKFNGAWLVQNFENLNPSNTFWTKQYDLYSKVDTETPRYLEFERWWGAHVNLNTEEIEFITDELFIGNQLAAGNVRLSDGRTIDLRAIRSPILIFCSKGDNITPPPQALGWLLQLYGSVDDIRRHGQTIVYSIHEKAGHLGIFVSGGVARKEHGEFASNIDLVDTLPPGLYEASFEKKTEATRHGEFVVDEWIMRCEVRTLDDIRALGLNSFEDDRRFATVARVSEINSALYRTFLRPAISALTNEHWAQAMRRFHPLSLPYEIFSDANPFCRWLEPVAASVKEGRRAAAPGNFFSVLEHETSQAIVSTLDAWRDLRDAAVETIFMTVYGSPLLQAAVGIDPASTAPLRKATESLSHDRLVEKRIAELKAQMSVGGIREAVVRAALYVGMPRGRVDERGFEMIRRLRITGAGNGQITLEEFKSVVREQFFMLLIDRKAALAAMPALMPRNPHKRETALALLEQVLSVSGEITGDSAERWQRIKRLFSTNAAAEEPHSAQTAAAARAKSRHTAII
jgi:pimeloyl-ACP methyl ester carboxylesterase